MGGEDSPGTRCLLCPDNASFLSFSAQHSRSPWGPDSALNGHPDSSPAFCATTDPQILLPPSSHAILGKFLFSSSPSFLICKMEQRFSVTGSPWGYLPGIPVQARAPRWPLAGGGAAIPGDRGGLHDFTLRLLCWALFSSQMPSIGIRLGIWVVSGSF